MHARPLNAAVKAEVAADLHGLPYTRITEHAGEAHIVTASLPDLEQWLLALGGTLYRQAAGYHTAVWTLHTTTSHDHGTHLVIHALTLDTDQIDAAYTHFVINEPTPHTPHPAA